MVIADVVRSLMRNGQMERMMRRWILGLFVLTTTCLSSAYAQSTANTPILNRIDQITGSYCCNNAAPIVGDFNNDGNTDFVSLAYKSGVNGLFLQTGLGRGDGSILSEAQTALPVGMQLSGAVVADFNSDQKQDIVALTTVTGPTSSPTYVSYFAGNGDGTFSAPTNLALPSGETPVQIRTADFNHDGHADMAVLCASGDLLLYLGNGAGGFQNPIESSTGTTNNNEAQFLVGDFNNDGFPDLLVFEAYNYNYPTYPSSIMLGNGDGSFKSPVVISQLPQQGAVQSFILTDLNGDGNLDILADLNNGSKVVFLAGNGRGGFGTPVVSVTLPTGFSDQSSYSPPALLDLNGDGIPDIVFSSAGNPQYSTMWAQGNGDGTFKTPAILTIDSFDGVYTVHLNAKRVGLFVPQVSYNPSSFSSNGNSVLYLPTTLPEAFEVSQASVDLGNVFVGSDYGEGNCDGNNPPICSAPFHIINRGTVPLTISSVSTQTPFSQLNDCPASLPVGQSCEIAAEFAPDHTGVQAGTISIGNGSSINPFQVYLTGTGVTPTFSLQPSSLTFQYQKTGTSSTAQTLTLTNLTGVPQRLYGLSVLTDTPGSFVESDDCPTLVVTSCTISIRFAPLSSGLMTASLEVWDANYNPAVSTLTGTAYTFGPAITVSPSSLSFGTPFLGTNSTPQTVTLTNTGDAPILLSNVAAGTGFTALNTCGNSIQPGANCGIGVFLDTSSTGAKSAPLTIMDNAPNSPQTVALSANVQSITAAAASGSSTNATLTSGGSATYNITVTPISGFSGSISIACNGAPAGYSCTSSPQSITMDGTTPVNVTITVNRSATASLSGMGKGIGAIPVVLGLCGLPFLFQRSFRNGSLWLSLMFAVVMSICVGCGGGSQTQRKSSSPTAPNGQNYTLTATFSTAGGGSVQLPLTLTEQN